MTLTTNFQETVNNVLQEALNTKSKRTSILLWTNSNLPNSFILKKDGKRYLGLPRKDRKGGDYWKFKEISGARPVMDKKDKENESNANSSE